MKKVSHNFFIKKLFFLLLFEYKEGGGDQPY